MNNFNEYECLKNIYSKMIMLTAISPITVLFFGPFLFLYILIPNLYIYVKYYKRHGNTKFEEHIRKILKTCLISLSVLFIFLLPLISMAFIDFTKIYQETAYMILMVAMICVGVGLLISWAYYFHNLMKLSKTVDENDFNKLI